MPKSTFVRPKKILLKNVQLKFHFFSMGCKFNQQDLNFNNMELKFRIFKSFN